MMDWVTTPRVIHNTITYYVYLLIIINTSNNFLNNMINSMVVGSSSYNL